MNPGGVKEMTALDPELSAAPLAAKRKWCKKHRERLLKLQSRIASSATGTVQRPVSGHVPPPVLHPQHSSPNQQLPILRRLFLRCHLYQSSLYRLLRNFLLHGKTGQQGKNDRSATILGILHPRNMARWETVTSNRDCGRFCCKREKIGKRNREQPRSLFADTQQSYKPNCGCVDCNMYSGGFIRSLERFWNCSKTNSTNGCLLRCRF